MGQHLHRRRRVSKKGDPYRIPGATPDGKGDYMQQVRDSKGDLIATVHGATLMQAEDRADMVVEAINAHLRG